MVKVRNPESGRYIDVDGTLYKRLVRSGKYQVQADGSLKPLAPVVSPVVSVRSTPSYTTRLLDLPDELIEEVCQRLDIPSLLKFRASSSQVAAVCNMAFVQQKIAREGGGRIYTKYLNEYISFKTILANLDQVIGYGPILAQWRYGKKKSILTFAITFRDILSLVNEEILQREMNAYTRLIIFEHGKKKRWYGVFPTAYVP